MTAILEIVVLGVAWMRQMKVILQLPSSILALPANDDYSPGIMPMPVRRRMEAMMESPPVIQLAPAKYNYYCLKGVVVPTPGADCLWAILHGLFNHRFTVHFDPIVHGRGFFLRPAAAPYGSFAVAVSRNQLLWLPLCSLSWLSWHLALCSCRTSSS